MQEQVSENTIAFIDHRQRINLKNTEVMWVGPSSYIKSWKHTWVGKKLKKRNSFGHLGGACSVQ